MPRLQDRVAIITGAARGQGLAEAKLFVAEAASVVMTDINVAGGEDAARELGDRAIFLKHDVTQEDDWCRVVEQTLAHFGRIDILVNNAGVYTHLPFQKTDIELLNHHYQVSAVGTFLGMKAVYPSMKKQGGGSIVNISSGAGAKGVANIFAYSAAKWMVRGLSKCAAADLSGTNIRVNTILPVGINTAMLATNSPDTLQTFIDRVPARRLGTAEEVAYAALFLASDESSYMFGAEIAVCGGALA